MSTLPPFSVEPVLERAFGEDTGIRAASVAAPGQVFLAGSDASLKIFDVSTSPPIEHAHLPSLPAATSVLSAGSSSTAKPKVVNKLSIVAHLNRAVVLSETLLTFHALPSLNPASTAATGILGSNSIKGVLAFDIDYASATKDSVELIILKRKGAALFRMTPTSVETLREVALPNQLITAIALRDWCLCYSDLQAYSLMDLRTTQQTHHFLPISQDHAADPDQPPNPDQRPAIIPVDAEFLLASHSGASTLGVFVSADSGDPSRGTMQWPSNVRSLALHQDLVMALLLDRTIQMHRHADQQHIFTLTLPEAITEPRSLMSCTNAPLSVPIPPDALQPIVKIATPLCATAHADDRPSTPDRTPDKPSFGHQDLARVSPVLASARVETFLLTRTSLSAIEPISLVQIAEHHLSKHAYGQALTVASASYCPNELKSYIHLRRGLDYLHQTNFDEAGPCFVMACAFGCDPRLFIRLFPDLRLSHWSRPTDPEKPTEAWVPSGAKAELFRYSSIDAVILANLTKNYSPHLNLQEDSANLTLSLQASSRHMIRLICESVRAQNAWSKDFPEVKTAVLTALAKLQAEGGADEECLARITEGGNAADLEEWLEERHNLHLLSKLYEQRGQKTDQLRVWAKMVDEEHDPLPDISAIAELAAQQADADLRLHYAFWLVERAPEIGLHALWNDVSLDSSEKQLDVYQQLQDRDNDLAIKYLDGVALLSNDQNLLRRFIDNALKRLDRNKESLEVSKGNTEDSPSFPDRLLTATAEEESLASITTLRLRFIALLSVKKDLDWSDLRARLERSEPLAFERSIVYGQLGLWRQGLSTLAISADDVMSAECFCVQKGVPLHPHTLRRILDALKVDFDQLKLNTSKDSSLPTDELMQMLIDILLNSGHPNSTPALTRFINAQSSHLEPMAVLERIPSQASLQELAPFFTRALRRSNHQSFDASIRKALAATQAMQTGEELYQIRSHIPPQIQTDFASSPTSAHEMQESKVIDLAAKLNLSSEEEPKIDIL